jgi:hypothetical protein
VGEFVIESVVAASANDYLETKIVNPSDYILGSAYPNPFNPTTSMMLTLKSDSYISVTVHNLNGQQVATLVNGRLVADSYELKWDATNHPSGVYFILFDNNSIVEKQKITLVK